MIVFRCRIEAQSPYDGALYSVQRTKPGVWEKPEQIHEHGNLGFYPALLVNAEGRLTDVFHFSFGGFHLVHSFRQANGWQAEAIGEQGDGYRLSAIRTRTVPRSTFSRTSIASTAIWPMVCTCDGSGATRNRFGNDCPPPRTTPSNWLGSRTVNRSLYSTAAMRLDRLAS